MEPLITIHSVQGDFVHVTFTFEDGSKHTTRIDGLDTSSEESIQSGLISYAAAYIAGKEIEFARNGEPPKSLLSKAWSWLTAPFVSS